MKKYFKIFAILFIVGILVFLKISSDKKQKEKELIKKIITIGEKVVNYKTFSLSNTSFSDIQDFYKINKADDKTQILLENCDASHFNSLKNFQKKLVSYSVTEGEAKSFFAEKFSISCIDLLVHYRYDLYSKSFENLNKEIADAQFLINQNKFLEKYESFIEKIKDLEEDEIMVDKYRIDSFGSYAECFKYHCSEEDKKKNSEISKKIDEISERISKKQQDLKQMIELYKKYL
jgi:uncharacterized coiled-coil protein SlyX